MEFCVEIYKNKLLESFVELCGFTECEDVIMAAALFDLSLSLIAFA